MKRPGKTLPGVKPRTQSGFGSSDLLIGARCCRNHRRVCRRGRTLRRLLLAACQRGTHDNTQQYDKREYSLHSRVNFSQKRRKHKESFATAERHLRRNEFADFACWPARNTATSGRNELLHRPRLSLCWDNGLAATGVVGDGCLLSSVAGGEQTSSAKVQLWARVALRLWWNSGVLVSSFNYLPCPQGRALPSAGEDAMRGPLCCQELSDRF
jgi:hypothetical protein